MDATWEMANDASVECGVAGERLGAVALPDVAALGRAVLSDAMNRTAAEIARRAAAFERIAVDGECEVQNAKFNVLSAEGKVSTAERGSAPSTLNFELATLHFAPSQTPPSRSGLGKNGARP